MLVALEQHLMLFFLDSIDELIELYDVGFE